jgi:hypothetical protein
MSRACVVWGEPLDHRRADAEVCGASCRRERSTIRALSAGRPTIRALSAGRPSAGYATLAAFLERGQGRGKGATRAPEGGEQW